MHVNLSPDLTTLLTDLREEVSLVNGKLDAALAELRSRPGSPPEPRLSFSTKEAARALGKAEYTVRQYCNDGRINAAKREERRGGAALWSVSAQELTRIKNEGLLPIMPGRNLGQ